MTEDLAALIAEHSYTYPDSFCDCLVYVGGAPERDWPEHVAAVLAPHIQDQVDELRCQLAASEIRLRAARLALAACAEVREARKSS